MVTIAPLTPRFDFKYVQNKINYQWLKNETECKVNFAPNHGDAYFIANADEKNAVGNARGIRIMVPDAMYEVDTFISKLGKSASNVANQLFFTKYKDEERKSSHVLNQNLASAPVIDFSDFSNGESLDQEDIVAWVNFGVRHFPRGEDLPVTLTNTANAHFMLVPFNYGDDNRVRDIRNSIIVKPNPVTVDQAIIKEYSSFKKDFCLINRPPAIFLSF